MNGFIQFLSSSVEFIFYLIITSFAIYVILELRMLRLSRIVERRKISKITVYSNFETDFLPSIGVFLPICNESSVVKRLIDAVCRLQYPSDRLKIAILDDSKDLTSLIAQESVKYYKNKNINIKYFKRRSQRGFKAGNLSFGLTKINADFVAIFDADFVPPPDFLLKSISCFKDHKLGFLQTGIDYENRNASFLTQFQAMEMGHQQIVTVGLSEGGNMASLSGSSCIWRRTCLEEMGGWRAATATEDVDIGYKAQLGDWKYAYLKDVVSMSILPETVSAFRVQRERWGRGLIHSAFKHCGQMFSKKMPILKRLHAISMMFSSLLLAAIYCLFLISLPLSIFLEYDGLSFIISSIVFFILVAVWGIGNIVGSPLWEDFAKGKGIIKSLAYVYAYVSLFLPMSLYYFVGGLRALFGIYEEFHRTPKCGDEICARHPKIDKILHSGEVFSFCYACCTTFIAIYQENYIVLPISITGCLGYGMILYWHRKDKMTHKRIVVK